MPTENPARNPTEPKDAPADREIIPLARKHAVDIEKALGYCCGDVINIYAEELTQELINFGRIWAAHCERELEDLHECRRLQLAERAEAAEQTVRELRLRIAELEGK